MQNRTRVARNPLLTRGPNPGGAATAFTLVALTLSPLVPAVAPGVGSPELRVPRAEGQQGEIRALGARFAPPVTDFSMLSLEPAPKMLALIERTSGVKRSRLQQARLFAGAGPGASSRRVITLPLDETLQGAHIALSIDDEGVLEDGFLWGRPDVDEDKDRTWRRIVEQFAWARVAAPDPARDRDGFDEVSGPVAYWKQLSNERGRDAKWTRLLYESRVLMINNSDFYQRVELSLKRKEVPSREWFASYLPSFERLRELGDEMSPFIGEAASERFQSSARAVSALIEDMALAAGEDQVETVVELFSGMQGACFRCHNIKGHDLGWKGPLVFPGIEARLGDYGVRNDLFRVGMDVWAPDGEEDSAQEIADAVQAALLLVGSSD